MVGRRTPRGPLLAAVGLLALLVLPGPAVQAGDGNGASLAAEAAAMPKPLFGGYTSDPSWYDAAIGPVQIYRSYDRGFSWATWQETPAYRAHGDAPEDYSFNLPPVALAAGAYDAELATFIASTPKDIILTDYHEPEQEVDKGLFTPAQFRAAIAHLAVLVHARNAADGGHRRVSVILMSDTVLGFKGRDAMRLWPGRDPATGRNYADLISFDTYELPHATGTPGVPAGFTDGLGWEPAQALLDPSIAFAQRVGSPWMVSEFGLLEDVFHSDRRAQEITDFVNYARLHGAVAVEYWDAIGPRADWRLRNGASSVAAWRALVDGP